jgi:septal ring factor EnvC (AmiA/AmiB activator)
MGKRILLGEGVANFGVRVLLGLLAVLLIAGFAAGCGLVSDQPKQEANEAQAKTQAKGKQAGQEVKRVGPSQRDLDKSVDELNQKVDDLDEKVGTGQEDLEKKVDHVQKDVNDLQTKVDELLKMAHALERQRQKQ